jgi:hypothetical protein
MKRALGYLLVIILCASMFVMLSPKAKAQNTSTNLITNPLFEDGLTGWNTSQGTAVYSVDSSTSGS